MESIVVIRNLRRQVWNILKIWRNSWKIQYLFIHLFISYIFMYLFSLSLLNSYWYSQNWVLGMENKVKSSRSQMFFRIGVFKIFVDFTGKRLWWILILVNYSQLY